MRRCFLWLIALITVMAAAGCGAGGGISLTASNQRHTYRNAAGWTIEVPPGWHVVRFSDSRDGITSAGVQLSNVPLPRPALVPGFPIQVNGSVLPARGAGLVIATDTDPRLPRGPVAVPPLPSFDAQNGGKYWHVGSQGAPRCSPGRACAGVPDFELLWFRFNGTIFIVSTKIGPKAANADRNDVGAVIRSLR